VKNALISFKKSANEFTMRKSAKNLSVVVPQLSAVLPTETPITRQEKRKRF